MRPISLLSLVTGYGLCKTTYRLRQLADRDLLSMDGGLMDDTASIIRRRSGAWRSRIVEGLLSYLVDDNKANHLYCCLLQATASNHVFFLVEDTCGANV